MNAKRAEEMLLLEQQMAFFQEKIRQSKEQALELEKRKLAIMSERSEATARARTLCFLHACLTFFHMTFTYVFAGRRLKAHLQRLVCACMLANSMQMGSAE